MKIREIAFSSFALNQFLSISYFSRRQDQDPGWQQREAGGGGGRRGDQQPVHLPPAPGVQRRGPGDHIPTFRDNRLRQGLHRQTDKPLKVFR